MKPTTNKDDLALFDEPESKSEFKRTVSPEDLALFDSGPKREPVIPDEPDSWNRVLDRIMGIGTGIKQAHGERVQQASDAMTAGAALQQGDYDQGITQVEELTRIGGNAVGFAGDIIWETVTGIAQTGWTLLPQSFRADISRETREAAEALANTSVGKGIVSAIEQGGDALAWAKENHPKEYDTLSQAINLGAASKLLTKKVGPGKDLATEMPLKPKTGRVTPQERLAAAEAGNRQPGQTLKGRDADVWKIIKDDSPKGREAAVRNMTDGGMGFIPKQRVLTAEEIALLDTVKKVPNISSAQNWQHNYNAISKKSKTIGNEIDTKLKALANTTEVTPLDVQRRLNDSLNKLANDLPAITGTPSTTLKGTMKKFEDMSNQALRYLDTTGYNVHGLYKARQEFDNLYKKLAEQAYAEGSAMPAANKEIYKSIRTTLNSMVDELDNGATKDLRLEQSRLITAADRVLPKAAKEAEGSLGRMYQRLGLVDASTPYGVAQNLVYKAALIGLSPLYFSGRAFQKVWKSAPIQTPKGRAAYTIRNMASEATKAMKELGPEARKEMALDIKVAVTLANQLEEQDE